MPWLVATALLHSLAVTEKRGLFKSWTVLLAIFAFSLSLLGTFLVRSGVLTSVHAFASDPERGVFILALLGICVGGSLLLYAIKAPTVASVGRYEVVSRETFLLLNNLVLVVMALAVLTGTLYPLVYDFMGLGKLSVGAAWFNTMFVPLTVALAILMGLGGAVAETASMCAPCPIEFIGVRDVFGESGSPEELATKYELTGPFIAEAARRVISRKTVLV